MDITHLSDVLDQVVKRLDQTQNLQDKLDHVVARLDAIEESQNSRHNLLDKKLSEMSTRLEEGNTDIHRSTETVTKTAEKKELGTFKEQINASMASLTGHWDTVKKDMAEYFKKIENVETSLFTVIENLLALKHGQDQLTTKVEQSNKKIESVESVLNVGHKTVREDLLAIKHGQDQLTTKVEQSNKKIESVESVLNVGHKTVREDLLAIKQGQDQLTTKMEQSSKKIESVQTSLNGGHKTMREDLAAIRQSNKRIVSVETSLFTVREDLIELKQGQNQLTTKVEQSINEVKADISWSKLEIFAVTEKEAQIVRDRIQGPLPSHGKYTFDFYVKNFKTLIRSDKYIASLPWHINEMKSCVKGVVKLQKNGEMAVFLVYGRRPLEVGLKPVPGVEIKVVATICDIYKKVLPDVTVGEGTIGMNETKINSNTSWGLELGVTSCDVLLQKGYGEKEGYVHGAVLVRYKIKVV